MTKDSQNADEEASFRHVGWVVAKGPTKAKTNTNRKQRADPLTCRSFRASANYPSAYANNE